MPNREPQDITEQKRLLRLRSRAARASIDAQRRAELSREAAQRLMEVPGIFSARVVLAYSAMAEELDPRPAVEALWARGVAVAMPRIAGTGTLDLHAVTPASRFVKGPMGIQEPPADAPQVEPPAIDAVIVPGVAYDEAGRRLGYGGGYYDQLIPQLRDDCLLVGFAFDEQVFEELPAEEHDRRVNMLVTPTRVLRFAPPGGL